MRPLHHLGGEGKANVKPSEDLGLRSSGVTVMLLRRGCWESILQGGLSLEDYRGAPTEVQGDESLPGSEMLK